ncbi:MAG: DMT family transporter [Thermodesulfobacteriota bacterium]
MHPEQNLRLGIIFGLSSAFIFALMSVLVKILGPEIPVSMLLFIRFLFSLIVLIPFLIRDKNFRFSLIPPLPKMYFLRITGPLIALGIIYYSINKFPLVNVLLLQNTAPLFVPIFAWFITGTKTPKNVTLGLVIGFIGVAVILNPTSNIFDDIYSMLPLFAGVTIAIGILYVRLIGKLNSPSQLFFYYFYISTLLTGIVAFFQWKTPSGPEQWILILGISLAGLCYQVTATYSYLKAPVRLMSQLVFMQTVFGGILDWIIWNHIPSTSTIVGALLVITGGAITVYFGMHLIKKS